ncbi:REF/SRPP-like protein [Sesamum angolense]|uniref:REF/SRPP-like protein n=1 Tax=Sesamum angolense TaxID=2727404 RepID=A0AAE2BVS0_9LAMI|nr:REF/SRPP-like protein [Sesamum angolense]
MASSQVEVQGSEMQLKHLGFVRILVINAAVLVSNLYIYAKQNSGPLKSTVGKVEDAVTAVVDEATYKFDGRAPPAAKIAASKAQSIVKKASKVLQDLAEEAKVDGPLAAISHAGEISKHFAVDKLALVWYKANQYPALHGVFEMAVPTAAHWSDKYNKLVKEMSSKGYSFFNYVPLVPVEEMGKAYKQVEAAAGKKADTGSSSESESDKE